jgi:hypothetical protein
MLLNQILTIVLFCVHLNVHGDIKNGWENPYYPYRRRPEDYFDKRLNQARYTLDKLQYRHRTPLSIFSKNYKKWLARKNAFEMKLKLKQEGKSLSTSSEEYKILLRYSEDKQEEAETKRFINKIENYRIKRYKTKSWIRARLQMGIGDATRPELMDGPFDNFWFERELLNYYKFSWKNLRFGLTITEIEKVLVIISFVRFCFYTIKYDAKSALIISLTAFISAVLYEKMLVDIVKICYFRFYLSPSLFRTGFEQYLQMVHNEDAYITYSLESFKLADIYPSWLIRFIAQSPILSEIQSFIDDRFMPIVFKLIRLNRKPMQSILFYTLVLRLGKKYVPYPLQWHGMVYVMYTQGIATFMFNRFSNSMKFLKDVLIPQARISEIQLLEMLQITFIVTLFYGIMLAMLHAIFSQYYYFPFIAQNIDAHIGKRPKDSILSGGYASWQDEQQLFIPSKADYKIWFGFLGKGSGDKKLKIKRQPKINIATNFIFLLIGLIIFTLLWILQPDNLESVRYQMDSVKLPDGLINEGGVEILSDFDYDIQQ